MSKVFVNVGLSLDGYVAPEGMTMGKPEIKNWGAKWGGLMAWIINQQYFRENLKLGPGGETGPVNDLLRSTTERIGANVMGKRMFDQGEAAWPEEAPFHTPVYVLTHERREPWMRPGGTTFYFINDGPPRALELARESVRQS
jgi:dihydrofolate reductase